MHIFKTTKRGAGDRLRVVALMSALMSALALQLIFGASKSDYLENKVLDHFLGKANTAFSSGACYMALCTAVPTDASTGTTITEANYTGYARKQIAAADWNAASSGTSTTATVTTFAACTAGSSTIIGFALCDALTVGNVLYWGTVTSKVIDTSSTPPTVAAAGISVSED